MLSAGSSSTALSFLAQFFCKRWLTAESSSALMIELSCFLVLQYYYAWSCSHVFLCSGYSSEALLWAFMFFSGVALEFRPVFPRLAFLYSKVVWVHCTQLRSPGKSFPCAVSCIEFLEVVSVLRTRSCFLPRLRTHTRMLRFRGGVDSMFGGFELVFQSLTLASAAHALQCSARSKGM